MTSSNSTHAQAAARLFVAVDGGTPGADRELAGWLAERHENERALERVDLAVALGKRLAADPSSPLHAEAERARRARPRRPWRNGLAWGGALAAAVLVAVLVVPTSAPPARAPVIAPLRAAALAAVAAPTNPIAVLPSGAVVDAGAVAVLPFAAADDAGLAQGLERDVVALLRTVPGLYVIADAAVSSYAATDLSPSEIGAQLGARGIVDAGVELVDGRVRVNARLLETATGATLWHADVDRSVDELRVVRTEIAERVATAMLDASLRPPVMAGSSGAAPAAAEPLQVEGDY
jgi:TolB-like protein